MHSAQERVVSEAKRFNVVVCGRRWGKTVIGLDRAVWAAMRGQPVGWFAPTYKLLSDPWREALRVTASIQAKISAQERRIELVTGGVLDFWSLDDVNAGRGRRYARVVIDEAAAAYDLKESWEGAIAPTLTDLKGDAWFCSTPRGYDYFHALYEYGQDPDHPEWMSWRMPTLLNPHMPENALAQIRATMDDRLFAQEFEASFEKLAGRVYFKFDRQENVREDIADTGGPLLIGMDFNVSPMSAVIGVRAGDELHVFDEIVLTNSNTEEMCQAIRHRFPSPRAITVYPDPSGNARKTAAPVGQTDFAVLRRAGFRVISPNAAPPVVDRINEVNALCCNAEGRRRLLLHPRCRNVIRSLMQLTYKDGVSLVDKSSGLDHCADAAGYLIHMEFPIIRYATGISPLLG